MGPLFTAWGPEGLKLRMHDLKYYVDFKVEVGLCILTITIMFTPASTQIHSQPKRMDRIEGTEG